MTKEEKKKAKAAAAKARKERLKKQSQWRTIQELHERKLRRGY